MEEELDLRIYIDILLKWWWLIALGAAALGACALLVSFILPPVYEATAGVVSLKSRAEVSLGSGFETITEDSIQYGNMVGSTAIVERAQQRLNTLAGMVRNGAIAQEITAELSESLDEEDRDPTQLLEYVEGHVLELENVTAGGSDTIQIVVSHKDPVVAALIANAWARAFELHVNSIYGEAQLSPFSDISAQLDTAKIEYDKSQEALLVFLSQEDQISELERQVTEEEFIINSLRTARQTAISAVVNKEVTVKQKLIDAYLEDIVTNRLFTFQRGQEAKRTILGTWIDAEIAARVAVIERDHNVRQNLFDQAVRAELTTRTQIFTQQMEELQTNLAEDYTRKHHLENLLLEARVMQEQLVKGGESSARSNGLALLAFKSRIFNTTEGLPFDRLDIQTASVDALNPNRSAAEQIADLDGLIVAMEAEVARLGTSIQEKSQTLLNGEGYQFLDTLSPDYLTLSLSQTLTLANSADPAGTGIVSPTLSEFIAQRYADLFNVGGMALESSGVAADTPLFAEIQKLYPELYSKDAWIELGESVPADSESVKLATQMADDLLKLQGMENVLADSIAGEPLSIEITRREQNVRALQAKTSKLRQLKVALIQNRDLTWAAYSKLLSKAQEVALASASEGSEVRFASPALPPRTPVSPRKMINTAVGIAVGLVGGVVCAFLFNYLGMENDPRALWAQLTKKKPNPTGA